MVKGKSGVIDIQTGSEAGVVRYKSGHLVVVSYCVIHDDENCPISGNYSIDFC